MGFLEAKTMKIDVIAEDIDCGIRLDSEECPVAHGLKRKFPKKFVSVAFDEILIGERSFSPPREVARFVKNFDRIGYLGGRDEPEPFSFELPIEV